MADVLTGVVPVITRSDARDEYTKSYQIRVPDADVGPKTQPYIDASVSADGTMLLLADVQRLADNTNIFTARGEGLERHGEELGIARPLAVGSNGFVTIATATGGATIQAGDELLHQATGLRFRCMTTATYTSTTPVPIQGIDTGPATNLNAGTVLVWTNPRPGCEQKATIKAQSNGRGLVGGRDAATDDEYRQVLLQRLANPPASGNDAHIREAVFNTPGVAVQAVWTYPAIKGPGTTAVAFTVMPDSATSGRIPSESQTQIVEDHVKSVFPGDFSIFVVEVLEQAVTVVLEASWRTTAPGFIDSPTWPPYVASDLVRVTGGLSGLPTPDASNFRLHTDTASTTAPQAGETIAFYNLTTGTFSRKRIGTVTVITAGKTWDITCDTSSNATDTTYIPEVGQAASPWSDSLDALVAPVAGFFNTNGPGEMVAGVVDPGVRQKRQPEAPDWPNEITNRLIAPVQAVQALKDASLLEPTIPYATTTGTPAVLVYLQTLGDLVVMEP
ncbi:MAG: baseplate J/gp47 family protein [Kofleriaceae bacterium]